MEIIIVCRCKKKSKRNSAKIIHRNAALKSFFRYFYAIIAIEHVFSCNNIRWVPRAMLKTSGCTLGFQHLPRNPANVNARKTCSIPIVLYLGTLTGSTGTQPRPKLLTWFKTLSQLFGLHCETPFCQ